MSPLHAIIRSLQLYALYNISLRISALPFREGVSTRDGLRFVRGFGLRLSVYADDADYAAASNDRMSVSGVAVMLGDTVIGWKSST